MIKIEKRIKEKRLKKNVYKKDRLCRLESIILRLEEDVQNANRLIYVKELGFTTMKIPRPTGATCASMSSIYHS